MKNTLKHARGALRCSTALHALALVGAGISGSAMLAAPATAQDYNQVTATGRVQGTDGRAVAGATVTVTSNDQGFTRTTSTDGAGGFRIGALPPGSYTFTVAADGYDAFTDKAVTLSQGASANQFTLASAGAPSTGDIVVTAGRAQTVDFNRNTTGAVINIGELATRVPVARDVTSVVLLSPGTSAGDTAFGNLPSINGASVSENVYYLNGLNITQFRNGLGAVTVPFDFYQTIDVKNGGIPAEFGRTTGGVINATTKSGTNDFHGGITFNWEPNGLRSKAPNTYSSDNDSSYAARKDMIAQLSGPIIKDHLFFYGIYNSRDVTSGGGFTATASGLDPRRNNAGAAITPSKATLDNSCFTNPTACETFGNLANSNLVLAGNQYIQDRTNSPFYGGKIDAVIIDGQRLEATYFNTSGITYRDVFGTAGTDAAGLTRTLANGLRYNPNANAPGGYASSTIFRSGGENYVGRYTGTFTNWLTLSAAYGRNNNRDTTESSLPNLPSIIDQRNGANASIGNTTSNSSTNFDKRTFYRADVDINVHFLGSHHFRGGYDREDLDERSFSSANGGFQYTYSTAGGAAGTIDPVTGLTAGTPYAVGRTFTTGGAFTTKNDAFYVQDSWQLLDNRLTLNLGIRDDRFISNNANDVSFYKSGNQWGPRLGFNFDPDGNGRTRVFGSFSRYYLPVAVNTNVRLAGSELDVDAYYRLTGTNADNTPILGAPITTLPGGVACPAGTGTGTSCVVRNDGTVASTGSTVASNLKPQSTDEIILGAETRIGRRIKVGAFFTYTKLNQSLEDASVDQAVVPYCIAQGNTASACSSYYNGVTQYVLINPGQPVTVELGNGLPNNPTATTVVNLSAASLGYAQAARDYRAMTFTFEREFDGKWSLSANYIYSKLVGNIEGGVRSDNGQSDSGLTTAFDLPALVNGSYGYLPNDRRHNFKIYGSYQFGKFLTLGANAQIASSRAFGCIGRVPANADGNIAGRFYGANGYYCNVDSSGKVVSQTITSAPGAYPVTAYPVVNPVGTGASTLQLTPRASQFKSDWLYLLNIDGTLKVPTDAFDGYVRVSVFNILNHQSKLDFQEFGTVSSGAPNATYGMVQTYQTPRYARIQFGVNF